MTEITEESSQLHCSIFRRHFVRLILVNCSTEVLSDTTFWPPFLREGIYRNRPIENKENIGLSVFYNLWYFANRQLSVPPRNKKEYHFRPVGMGFGVGALKIFWRIYLQGGSGGRHSPPEWGNLGILPLKRCFFLHSNYQISGKNVDQRIQYHL